MMKKKVMYECEKLMELKLYCVVSAPVAVQSNKSH